MFAEEEWTDSPFPDGSSHTVKTSPAPGKDKFVGKRSLLKTLQTLGSVPDWDTGNVCEDSDEEKDASTTVKAPKKKRCKKRKRTSNAANEGKQQDKVDSSEPPVKKKTAKKTANETSSKVSQESRKETNDKGVGPQLDKKEGQAENELSRKQWRNKMKNIFQKQKQISTKNNNQYLKKNKPILKKKHVKESKKVKKHDRASKKAMKFHEKNGISSISDNAQNCKDSKTDDTSSTGARIVDVSLSNNKGTHKGKPSKMMKNSQAEKLRRILKSQLPDDGNKASEEPQEPKGTTVSLKGDEEKGAPDPSTALRTKMEKQLEAARFRYINELLYTSTSGEAKRMFQQDPQAIAVYHKGYTTQVQHWPTNPVDSIISYICKKPASLVVADFGCGDCKIARSVKNKVHSFDLAPVCDLVTACDMAKVPLRDSTVDIAVFCLSLMGTNLGEFLAEANRVLVMEGVLKIAEVASRFENVRLFIGALSSLGFKLVNKDTENSHFYSFEFIKTGKAPVNVKKVGLQLKPCLYKKR
ncbi:ribosomal RNA-processing protein 8-like [Cyprinus carpio]|uniref:Ribosomal RNA-processing protein 8 n=1 Tax=Cyprinus carpio TaxID=7962 RepID=A0A9Q9YWB1_CYPCA|nr:ribosomal RNA-processing protein 8-like [Cyprinus carpio]XP_042626950.1 ribosomal RNA-processing protein 8-like [Cyprinus carpio]XP_042626951.1 ribosomal RNA-processing protein 8-like [Cyprinus carpio]